MDYSEFVENKMPEEFEKECMCTTPEYTIYLEAQGPQGKTGPEGPEGFSPSIGVYSQSETNYQLRIINKDGQIITPNLKASFPAGGYNGAYLRHSGNGLYWGSPDRATEDALGVVYLASTEDFTPDEEGNYSDEVVVTPNDLIPRLNNKQNTLVAGDNITLASNDDGTVTISSVGGDVTYTGESEPDESGTSVKTTSTLTTKANPFKMVNGGATSFSAGVSPIFSGTAGIYENGRLVSESNFSTNVATVKYVDSDTYNHYVEYETDVIYVITDSAGTIYIGSTKVSGGGSAPELLDGGSASSPNIAPTITLKLDTVTGNNVQSKMGKLDDTVTVTTPDTTTNT